MYACIPEIERGFFQGVCTPSRATANFCDPPPPPLKSRVNFFASTVETQQMKYSPILRRWKLPSAH
jgi:hypothetical protein